MRDPKGDSSKTYGLGYRHFVAVLASLLGFVGSFLQAGVTVGVVSMTSKNSSNPDFEEFHWPSTGKNAILSSFFWGSLVGSLPAGHFGQSMNVKILTIIATFAGTLLSSAVPLVARAGGWQALCALVATQGFLAGFFNPAIYIVISRWATTDESTTMLGIANLGNPLGAAIALPLCGFLAKGPGGWPSIYYCQTIVGIVWSLLFFIFGASRPSECRFLSNAEKEYILLNQNNSVAKKAPPTPWGKLLTSKAVIVLTITELCNGFGSSLILSELPSYIQDVLKLSISMNGIVSALPIVCVAIFLTPSGWMADYFARKGTLSRNASRKLYTFIGLGVNGTLLIICGLVGKNATVVITLMCMATACATLTLSGFHSSHLDLAPNFAGVLMALTSIGGHLTGVIAPITVGLIVTDNSVQQWMWVFIETGSVLIFGCLVYILFGTTDLQSWNNIDEEEDKRNEISTGA